MRDPRSRQKQLLALSGERNPYPGRPGVVEPGALADLLLVNGNPLDDLQPDRLAADIVRRHHEGWDHLA